MTLRTPRIHAALLVVATMLFVMLAAPSAQRGRRAGGDATAGMPIATNTILENPEAYFGKAVTITAGVEQMVSKTAFLVDQRKAVSAREVKAIGKPILVIAPYLTATLDRKSYLLMRGEIVKFDPAAMVRIAADYTIDLASEVAAKYKGLPVLVATSVVDSTYAELARKPIPPPGTEELALMAAMKAINPAFAALRTAVQDSRLEGVTQNVATLKPAFSQAETAWDDLGQTAAADWARDALAHTVSIESAAAAGNWEAVKNSALALNQVCQTCHAIYRERLEDGTFRIKPGSF